MEFIKKFCIYVIPLATFLSFLAIGISYLLGNTEITYFERIQLASNTLGGDTFTNSMRMNWSSYLQGITNTDSLSTALENIVDATTSLFDKFARFIEVWTDGYQFGDVVRSVINVGILILDTVAYVINEIIYILIFSIMLGGKMLNLIGIKTSADIGLFNAFRTILTFSGIPYINPLT